MEQQMSVFGGILICGQFKKLKKFKLSLTMVSMWSDRTMIID
jgi:hypothetical protein